MKKQLHIQTHVKAGETFCLPMPYQEDRNHPDFWQNMSYYQTRTCNQSCGSIDATGTYDTWGQDCGEWQNVQRGFLGIGGA